MTTDGKFLLKEERGMRLHIPIDRDGRIDVSSKVKVGVYASAVFAFIGGFFVNVNKEVPINTKPLTSAQYTIPASEAHKYRPQFNVSFGSVAHADAMTAREQILNYPWDEVYNKSNYNRDRFLKSGDSYIFDDVNQFCRYFSNPSHLNAIGQDPNFFLPFFRLLTDGSLENGELVRITYMKKEKAICFSIKYKSDFSVIVKKFSQSADNYITGIIGSKIK